MTRVEIGAALLARTKRHARRAGRVLRRARGRLRRVLGADANAAGYEYEDRSVGEEGGASPLGRLSWQALREEIYGPGL